VEAHSHKVISQRAEIHPMVETLEPAVACLVVEDLMFGTTGFSLFLPSPEEFRLTDDLSALYGPFSESLAAGAIRR
jgi:hypothetical protein